MAEKFDVHITALRTHCFVKRQKLSLHKHNCGMHLVLQMQLYVSIMNSLDMVIWYAQYSIYTDIRDM